MCFANQYSSSFANRTLGKPTHGSWIRFLQSSLTNSIISPGRDWPGTVPDWFRHRITSKMAGIGTHFCQRWQEVAYIHADMSTLSSKVDAGDFRYRLSTTGNIRDHATIACTKNRPFFLSYLVQRKRHPSLIWFKLVSSLINLGCRLSMRHAFTQTCPQFSPEWMPVTFASRKIGRKRGLCSLFVLPVWRLPWIARAHQHLDRNMQRFV